jgi:hypothetical protein
MQATVPLSSPHLLFSHKGLPEKQGKVKSHEFSLDLSWKRSPRYSTPFISNPSVYVTGTAFVAKNLPTPWIPLSSYAKASEAANPALSVGNQVALSLTGTRVG